MSLYNKYRPKEFSEMVGNKSLITAVSNMMDKKNVPHSWMFSGISGTGKTTIARIISYKLGASRYAIKEINTSNVRGIDGMRAILDLTGAQAIGSPVSVFILDECHQLTKEAQNSLLPILEEPPSHIYFFLTTTNPEKLLKAIRTRCEHFKFKPVSVEDLADLLVSIVDKEGLKVNSDIIIEVAKHASGSPRLAINMLEAVAHLKDDVKQARELLTTMAFEFEEFGDSPVSGDIVNVLFKKSNRGVAWGEIAVILDRDILKDGVDGNTVLNGVAARLGRALLKNPSGNLCKAILELNRERGYLSNALLIAIMYKMVLAFYGESNERRIKRKNKESIV